MIKKLCVAIVELAGQYQREQQHREFGIPANVSFYNISIEGNVSLGEYTYINEYSRIDSGSASRVDIGKHCAIGRYVHITSRTHDLRQPTSDKNHPIPGSSEADVRIGNFVWIGDKATILPGVTIGDYAVIAAHSLVKNNVLPFEMVGGTPARHIRFNEEHYQYPNFKKHP